MKLLQFYRKVKFCPQVFEGLPQEKWQLLEIKTDQNSLIDKARVKPIFETPIDLSAIKEQSLELKDLPVKPEPNLDTEEIDKLPEKDVKPLIVKLEEKLAPKEEPIIPEIKPSLELPAEKESPKKDKDKVLGSIKDEKIINDPDIGLAKFGNSILKEGKSIDATVKNWLSVYTDFCGSNQGNLALRVSFLNNFPEAQKLNISEKERLGLILKSYDENIVLEFSFVGQKLDVNLPKKDIDVVDLSAAESYSLSSSFEKPKLEEKIDLPKKEKPKSDQIDFSKDGAEVLSAEIDTPKNIQQEKETLDKISQEIKTGIKDSVLENRFKKILETRLNGVRDKLRTKEVLKKEISAGGLGLSQEKAEEITVEIEKFVASQQKTLIKREDKSYDEFISGLDFEENTLIDSEVEKAKAQEINDEVDEISKLIDSQLEDKVSTVKEKEKDQTKEQRQPTVQDIYKDTKSKDLVKEIESSQKQKSNKDIFKTEAVVKTKEPEKIIDDKGPALDLSKLKKFDKITDISPSRKAVGPIEELRILNLESFRRLGDSAEERIQKIQRRLKVFESESLSKFAEGIAAWKNSEVYRMYQKIGQESLLTGISIHQVIQDKKDKNKPTLTFQEFEAIGEFNKTLRF